MFAESSPFLPIDQTWVGSGTCETKERGMHIMVCAKYMRGETRGGGWGGSLVPRLTYVSNMKSAYGVWEHRLYTEYNLCWEQDWGGGGGGQSAPVPGILGPI